MPFRKQTNQPIIPTVDPAIQHSFDTSTADLQHVRALVEKFSGYRHDLDGLLERNHFGEGIERSFEPIIIAKLKGTNP